MLINEDKMATTNMRGRRVVLTGTGVVAPTGMNTHAFWEKLVDGMSGISQLTGMEEYNLPVKVAAQVADFDPQQYMDRREARRMDRYCQFAVAAAAMAVADSGFSVDDYDPWRVGTIIGSGVGGLETLTTEFGKLYGEAGAARISPLFIPMMIANMAAGKVSMIHGTKGSSLCVTTACASGTHAIGEAFRSIKYGHLDACIAGGAEAPITAIAIAGFSNMKALTSSEDPAQASMPFDSRRSGFVIGEGAGILVLESLEHAQKRGANIICEIAGYGSTADAYHITSPDPEGKGAAHAMQQAIHEAGLQVDEIDYINAHGTSTPLNDKYETIAIHSVFDGHGILPAVSSNKSMIGHLLGAAGAVEAIATALTLQQDVIPPTINLNEPDPECDLDYVPHQARKATVKAALSNSLGFGGHNGCLCLKKWEDK